MIKKFPYNPRESTSARSCSGCMHRYLSKFVISLLTKSEFIDVFKKTLIGGFSCVNTRLVFDFYCQKTKTEMKKNLKLIYKIRNRVNNNYEDKRLVGKILKIEENNQDGSAMTKPTLTGSIKQSKKTLILRNFNLIVEGISDEDKIGHVFIVDIQLNK